MRIEGHCPKISGLDLAKFIYQGVDADHTQQTPASLEEKLKWNVYGDSGKIHDRRKYKLSC